MAEGAQGAEGVVEGPVELGLAQAVVGDDGLGGWVGAAGAGGAQALGEGIEAVGGECEAGRLGVTPKLEQEVSTAAQQ